MSKWAFAARRARLTHARRARASGGSSASTWASSASGRVSRRGAAGADAGGATATQVLSASRGAEGAGPRRDRAQLSDDHMASRCGPQRARSARSSDQTSGARDDDEPPCADIFQRCVARKHPSFHLRHQTRPIPNPRSSGGAASLRRAMRWRRRRRQAGRGRSRHTQRCGRRGKQRGTHPAFVLRELVCQNCKMRAASSSLGGVARARCQGARQAQAVVQRSSCVVDGRGGACACACASACAGRALGH